MGSYIPTIGLEIHIQLNLENKIFCPEKFVYGAFPNSLTSIVSLGYPGVLPIINKNAIEQAIKLGFACNCEISNVVSFDRKNYFYPDLTKGYQITQEKNPICKGGCVFYTSGNIEKKINLTRIHLEEDVAKTCLKNNENNNLKTKDDDVIYNKNCEEIILDYNRAGVGLLEMVTNPEFSNGEDVYNFLHELRRIVRFLKISNGNMEEGSLRCDVNISLKSEETNSKPNRVEIKNINSIKNVQNAIEYEIYRQTEILNSGKNVNCETRMFNANSNNTIFMRSKGDSSNYKYIQEFDINPIQLSDDFFKKIKKEMPILPKEYKKKLMNEYKLSEYFASVFVENIPLLQYYESICEGFKNYKVAANWILGPIKGLLNEYKFNIYDLKINTKNIQELMQMVMDGKISYTAASQDILRHMFENPEIKPFDAAIKLNLLQVSDYEYINKIVDNVLEQYNNKVIEYKNGKKGLLGLFVGKVIKISNGKANPKIVNDIISKKIEQL